MFALVPLLAAGALLCDSNSKPAAWLHKGPAGYVDGIGSMIGVASSGAAQAAVHVAGTEWLLATANPAASGTRPT